jgi:hypothetical protein
MRAGGYTVVEDRHRLERALEGEQIPLWWKENAHRPPNRTKQGLMTS